MKKLCMAAIMFMGMGGVVLGADFKWAGVRIPTKVSGVDGLNEKQLDKKIGSFILLDDAASYAKLIESVRGNFAGSKPWVTWAVGSLKGSPTLTEEQHEKYLAAMDAAGVEVYLEVWPSGKDAAGVETLMDEWLGKFKGHACVKGFGVDLEYYKPKVDDATAKRWEENVKSFGAGYRLFLKHWETDKMPATYRGDIIFIDMSSEAPMAELNDGFGKWAEHFAPAAVGFQIGYPADEDEMNGGMNGGWWTLKDPIKEWGEAILAKLPKDGKQEVGLLWVTGKSGKTFNSGWDLMKGMSVPGQ